MRNKREKTAIFINTIWRKFVLIITYIKNKTIFYICNLITIFFYLIKK